MANIKLTANEKQFVAAMQKAEGAAGKLRAEININLVRAFKEADYIQRQFAQGIDRVAREAEQAAKKAEQMKAAYVQSFKEMGDKVVSVGKNLSAYVTLPILAVSAAAIKTYGDIDQLKRALDTYGVSLNEIKKTAKLPGLGIEEAGQATIKFLSVKYAADLSNKAVREFGNALVYSGRGKEELGGIATAFAQMKGKGAVMAQEINQIAERLPMIRDLMMQAFGTSDTETLQKMGISGDKFLEEIVKQLEKLPRVSGGLKVAMENIGDSFKLASYEVVNIGDKLFDFTGIANKVSEIIDSVVESFKNLSPETQKLIFGVVGVSAAIGPMVVAVGAAIKAYGALFTGVGLATAAVSAFLVVLAGAGILYAEHSEVANKLAKAARSLSEIEEEAKKSILQQTIEVQRHIDVLKSANSSLEDRKTAIKSLNDISPEYFGNLNAEKVNYNDINTALNQYIKNLENIAKVKVLNQQLETSFKVESEILANPADATSWFEQTMQYLNQKAYNLNHLEKSGNREQFVLALAQNAAKAIIAIRESRKGIEEELKKLAELGYKASVVPNASTVTNIIDPNKFVGVLKNFDIKKLSFFGDLDLKIKEEGTKILATSNEFWGQVAYAFNAFGINIWNSRNLLQMKVDKLFSGIQWFPKNTNEGMDAQMVKFRKAYYEKFGEILSGDKLNSAMDFSKYISQQLEGAVESGLESIGASIGSGEGLNKAFKGIMQMVGDFMIQLGKKLLKIDVLIKEAVAAIGTGPLAIPLAIGLIVAGSAIKASSLKQPHPMADGGLVYDTSYIMAGEYAGARTNPEVIAPLSDLKGMLGDMLGGGFSAGELRIEGESIVIPINRYLKRRGLSTLG